MSACKICPKDLKASLRFCHETFLAKFLIFNKYPNLKKINSILLFFNF